MSMLRYCCLVVGEDPAKAQRYHESTLRRLRAFAIALHLPVLLWAISSWTIASQVFGMAPGAALCTAALCSIFIYLVERLVLDTPSGRVMNLLRLVLGVIIACIGASLFDLVLFDKEIAQRLQQHGEQALRERHAMQVSRLEEALEGKRADWLAARHKAQCEADGSCSGQRGTGPIFQQAQRHADVLHNDYAQAQANLAELAAQHARELAEMQASRSAVQEAGLLMRVKALHEFVVSDVLTLVGYGLVFLLVLMIELIVVIVKSAYRGETIDDRLQSMREQLAEHRARTYLQASTSPVAYAHSLVEQLHGTSQ
jgi:heme/copper-type cytochrome/quinol oxidase subunit 4